MAERYCVSEAEVTVPIFLSRARGAEIYEFSNKLINLDNWSAELEYALLRTGRLAHIIDNNIMFVGELRKRSAAGRQARHHLVTRV